MLKLMYKQIDLRELREQGSFIVWVIGGPASGKTSLCSRFAQESSFIHISISELLHDLISDNVVIGRDTTSTIKKGQLVPTEFILFVIKQEIAKNMARKPKGFLLDGFPLNLEQARRFEKEVAPVNCIVNLIVNESNSIERIYYHSKTSKGVVDHPKNVYTKLKLFREFHKTFNKKYLTKMRDIDANAEFISVYKKFSVVINDMIIKHFALQVLNRDNTIN